MVPRRRNALTTQRLGRSREPLWVLRQALVSGPITALASTQGYNFWEALVRPSRRAQGRKGSVNTPELHQSRTITKASTVDKLPDT